MHVYGPTVCNWYNTSRRLTKHSRMK
uniref:Uncharacterized protein n=1 Tax=Anguilla anguilla TaxID=7936 RepID=A0A0E9SND1_ANGAN